MASLDRDVRSYPSEKEVEWTRDILKPPGLLSNSRRINLPVQNENKILNYNKSSLKKVERPYVSAKDTSTLSSDKLMYQTDYMLPIDATSYNSPYFNVTTKRATPSTYDRINHVVEGYNQKLHRDDRHHAKAIGLKLHKEESARCVPATSNAVYGHPKLVPLAKDGEKHGHTEICKQDFLRVSGVNSAPTEE